MAIPNGRPFYKMTGSGNDFVFVIAITEPAGALERPDAIRLVCARGTGVGADGIVFLEPPLEKRGGASFRMRYLNSDGSVAAMCGNAALCAARLAAELGLAPPSDFVFETESGSVTARMRDGLPEIDLAQVWDVRPDAGIPSVDGELRIGFALVGVPHLVVLCDDLEQIPVVERGRALRRDPSLPQGANVNFVAPRGSGFAMRTYERGVEGETLACGTGAVAAGIMVNEWAGSTSSVELETRSSRTLSVTAGRLDGHRWTPSLRGEGRLVFSGHLGELGVAL
ncbi:MAG: diaminopimelate epimerase [Gemmatimonadaceae bacterium]